MYFYFTNEQMKKVRLGCLSMFLNYYKLLIDYTMSSIENNL